MRLVIHIAHTVLGFIVGYGVCFFILSYQEIGDSAPARDRLAFFNEAKELSFIVGGIGAACFFVGSLMLVKTRHVKYNRKLDAKAAREAELMQEEQDTEEAEVSEVEETTDQAEVISDDSEKE